ncbi:hypothetical protein ACP49_04220 [Clostridium botulinum]|nr:hypothetical protein RSJ15_02620 [Clostridium botulinum]KOM96505.1 hypothetical protein ACP53_12105 [Clostridium botulinum]KOM99819.1 hypothetical protein ACP49_04220 [Clostridium botulinum]MBN3361393.1 hypothetical protein [Clostridium botulinum]MCS6166626.1 hypothetical protein [Clostridium botulinum]
MGVKTPSEAKKSVYYKYNNAIFVRALFFIDRKGITFISVTIVIF